MSFLLISDRNSFFEVIKFWIHYEFKEKLINNCEKFDILFMYTFRKIEESKIFMMSKEWISFIQTLPTYPPIVFKHIYQIAKESIHKEVAGIKICSLMLLSKCHKNSIKKE